jgi:hypothetical protein
MAGFERAGARRTRSAKEGVSVASAHDEAPAEAADLCVALAREVAARCEGVVRKVHPTQCSLCHPERNAIAYMNHPGSSPTVWVYLRGDIDEPPEGVPSVLDLRTRSSLNGSFAKSFPFLLSLSDASQVVPLAEVIAAYSFPRAVRKRRRGQQRAEPGTAPDPAGM